MLKWTTLEYKHDFMPPKLTDPWASDKTHVLELLKVSPESGLSSSEAKRRTKLYGLNKLAEKQRFHLFFDFIEGFLNPFIILLIAASLISALLGQITDFLIILTIILTSGLLSFYQHYKAENEVEKLKQKILLTADVIRDGVRKEIPFSAVTIGDILLLKVGDVIPADARLLKAKDLSVNEAVLSGESLPVEKQASVVVLKDTELSERKNMVFMGTHIEAGEGQAVVVAVGKDTSFGRLSKEIQTKKPNTSFDQGLNNFGFLLMRAVILLTLFVFLVNTVLKHDVLNSFIFALALAVGLTPELLPIILTINLSRGALRMGKKDVIVKYLPAIQNFGSMDILCTDKTGTLTENQIALNSFEDVRGNESRETLLYGIANSYFQSGYKNPLETTLLGYQHEFELDGFRKLSEIPFDFERKRLSVVLKDKKGKIILVTKGSPHKIFPLISHYRENGVVKTISQDLVKLIEKRCEELSGKGLLVLAVCKKEIEKKISYSTRDEKDLTFLGFLTFSDPPKQGVLDTIAHLRKLGVNLKVLTGDNEIVTKKVCEEVNLDIEGIMLGHEIEKMSADELRQKVTQNTVFARLTPEQKSRIIFALKENGHTVGYLGDGINDAPPLKSADVGISVHNGSEIARDVADIILMKKSLSVLRDGVIEGRKTYANILKYIMMGTSSNFGNMISVAISSMFLPFLPMLPTQILLNNLLYDTSQLSLPQDNVDVELLKKPKNWDVSFIKNFMIIFGLLSSIFDFFTFGVLLYFFHASSSLFQTGWFVESLTTQSLIILSLRTSHVPFFTSKPSKLLITSIILAPLVGIILPNMPFGSIFGFVRLPFIFYLVMVCFVVSYFVIIERAKSWFYRRIKQ